MPVSNLFRQFERWTFSSTLNIFTKFTVKYFAGVKIFSHIFFLFFQSKVKARGQSKIFRFFFKLDQKSISSSARSTKYSSTTHPMPINFLKELFFVHFGLPHSIGQTDQSCLTDKPSLQMLWFGKQEVECKTRVAVGQLSGLKARAK